MGDGEQELLTCEEFKNSGLNFRAGLKSVAVGNMMCGFWKNEEEV